MYLSQAQLQSPRGRTPQVPKQEPVLHSVVLAVVSLSVVPFDCVPFSFAPGGLLLFASPHLRVCLYSAKAMVLAQKAMEEWPLPQLACPCWNIQPGHSTCGVHICRE